MRLPSRVVAGSEAIGGVIDLARVPSDDPSLSPMQLWCNESQERYVLGVAAEVLPGFVPDAVLRLLYQSTDLFVFPSLYETFGFTYCPDVCPTTLADLRGALRELGSDAGRVGRADGARPGARVGRDHAVALLVRRDAGRRPHARRRGAPGG